jgi:hypothetical protein
MSDSDTDSEQVGELDWATSPDVDAALDELEDSSPRAAAVLGGALVEDLLDRLLAGALPDDNEARLQSGEIDYFKKGHWAFRMGLISKLELRELRLLGRIRNEFAHSWSADLGFGSDKIKDRVRGLDTPDHLVTDVTGSGRHLVPLGNVAAYIQVHEKNRWLIAVNQMMIRLLNRIEAAERLSVLPDHEIGN